MRQSLFDIQNANRLIKLEYVAEQLGLVIVMPDGNNNYKNLNNIANELSSKIDEGSI